jgi:hypothetical protein
MHLVHMMALASRLEKRIYDETYDSGLAAMVADLDIRP